MKDFFAMAEDLTSRFRDTGVAPWDPEEFDRRALAAFHFQFRACDVYGAFCRRREVTPDTVTSWTDVPSVPTTAFKSFDFRCVDAERIEAVFRTSGTTRGRESRGRHFVPSLELYRASCLGPFRAALLPDLDGPVTVVSLVPPPADAPHSSLSFMVGAVVDRFAGETAWMMGADGRWTADPASTFRRLWAEGRPVLVLATSLALAHLVDGVSPGGLALPEGSRVMQTGGFKGVRRSVTPEGLVQTVSATMRIPQDRIVTEYGMTELLSQLYDAVLTDGPAGAFRPPPWLAVRALDPTTLSEVPEGEDGILAFFDLANLGSVCAVLTEDVGSVQDGSVRLKGRNPGAEPRGCSRAMDDLMESSAR